MGRLRYYALFVLLILVAAFYLLPVKHLFNEPTSTIIFDSEGGLLGAKISKDGQWRFPSTGSVPEKFSKALIAFEDKRFYRHPGIDLLAMARALRQNIKAGKTVSGGSTLTMQVIRLSRKGKPRTFFEKVIESVLAIRLELAFSKEEILSMYASNAPFGGNVVGLNAASWRYFGRQANDLSCAEAATLAVLPNAPALIHPGRNRDHLFQKRNNLLLKLSLNGVLSEEDYQLSLLEPVPEKPLLLPSHAIHLLERLHSGYPGQVIQTSIQGSLQHHATRIVHQFLSIYNANKIHHAAVLVINNKSGQVMAYVGNAVDPALQLQGWMNDMITAPRSSGSILKPFLFAGAFNEGLILSTTILPDFPFQTEGFHPQNYDLSFDGAVSARRALQRSLNVPSVRLLQQFGVAKLYNLLKGLGMSTLNRPPDHYGLSLILGGAECTLWDITSIFARLSRILNNYSRFDGMYHPTDLFQPSIITAESQQIGKEDLSAIRNELEPTAILDASSIWETFHVLLEVNRPEGEAGWKEFSSTRGIAWKTGTSYGNRDAWAVGTTPEYTVGVWVGNASGEGRPSLTGVGYAAPLLFDVFNVLPKTSSFYRPYDDMELVNLCRISGQIAGRYCIETDSAWIPGKGLRTISCNYHIPLLTDASGSYRVNSDCYEVHRMVSHSWFVLPPAMEWFYRIKNPDYKPLPPFMKGCAELNGQQSMQLLYPLKNTVAILPRELSGKAGKIVLQAVHRNATSVIFWHMDGIYLGATSGQHNMAVSPLPGEKRLVLVDENGQRIEQVFTVVLPK